MTISKKLAEKLVLNSSVFITVYDAEGYIALSPAAIDKESVSYKFSNDTEYIVYNAALVQFLADTFELDYVNKTSNSFSNVEFTTHGDIPVAIVTLKKAINPSIHTIEEESIDEGQT